MINPIEKVIIASLIPLYKNGEAAQNIELVTFRFAATNEPCGYEVVSQKGLYNIGDAAYYVQPDYCVGDNELFNSFIAPNGDPKKSRLGKNNRIRAIKFNFTKIDSSQPIYSFGILLQRDLVSDFLHKQENNKDYPLAVILGIAKYEEPEKQGSGLSKGEFPSWLYKTDEDNVNNQISLLEQVITDGEELGFSEKVDGSSWTMSCRKNDLGGYDIGVYSRSLEKKLDQRLVQDYIDKDGNIYSKYYDRVEGKQGWYSKTSDLFYTQEEIDELCKDPLKMKLGEFKEVKDSWVDIAKKYNLFEKLPVLCKLLDVELVIRGELHGQGLKGSGNKKNPFSNVPADVRLFGVDKIINGVAIRAPYNDDIGLPFIAKELGVQYAVNKWYGRFASKEELFERIGEYFDEQESKGRLVEGVVVRTTNNNKLSLKVMNSKYDACK